MSTQIQYHESPNGCYGEAIKSVRICTDGSMWIGNGEYSSRVNFNPYTGEKAPFQMKNNGEHCDDNSDSNEMSKTRWI